MIRLAALALLLVGCRALTTQPVEDIPVATVRPTEAQSTQAASAPVVSTDDVQRIDPAEAKALVDAEEGVLIDTRSAESYSKWHATGAISLPESEATERFGELPADKAVIFY